MESQEKIGLNTFQSRLIMDPDPLYQPEGSYTYLLNGRKMTESGIPNAVSNALSNTEFSEDLGEIVGITLIEERNQFLVFSLKGGATIFLVETETGKSTEVVNLGACGINFRECENIYAEFKTMQPCSELYVYFSSGCTYYTINIDELLDEGRKQCFDCDSVPLFRCVCIPELEPQVSSASGGNLKAGAYRFAAQLEDETGNTTNWFNISQPLSIDSENNIAGEVSRKSILITLTDLDTRYRKLNLAVIKNIGGVETAETFPSFYYSGTNFTFEYYGQEGFNIAIEEILTKRRTYIKGQDLVQRDNQLMLYNIKHRRNLDYQRRANNIQVKGVVYVARAEDAHKYKTLIRGERYLLSLGWNYCTSEKSPGFVLSNYPNCGVNLDMSCFPEDLDGAPIDPRSTGEPVDTNSDRSKTLEETREGDEFQPNGGPPVDDAKDRNEELLDDAPDVDPEDVDTCEDCGGIDQWSESHTFFDSFGAVNIDVISNVMNENSKNKKGKKVSGNIKDAIKNLMDSLKDYNDDPEENKTVYDVFEYSPANRKRILKDCLEKLTEKQDLAELGEFCFKTFESSEVYPLTLDCNCDYIYGDLAGKPIRLLEVPGEDEIPFFVSFQRGVKSQKTLGVDEFEDAFVFLIGLKVENIEYPEDDELHSPLCSKNPFTIYMAETTPSNRRVVAKGIMPHTFAGEMNGKTYAFPKHGVNSFETVDRHIQNGDDFNHFGSLHNVPIFTFLSPDTTAGRPYLSSDRVFIPGTLSGQGFMHGQYAFGEDPVNSFFGRQQDQRGVRQSANLNVFTPQPVTREIVGMTYAPGNKVVSEAQGIDYGICNLYRESSVALQLDQMPPNLPTGRMEDQSFVGVGLYHSDFLPSASAHYAVLLNEIPNQYGSVESLVYIDTGLSGKNNETFAKGIAGDGFIGPWTVKRTSYVSNKVGDEPIHPSRRRVGSLLQFFGVGDCTRPPDSGDNDDAKNRACLHPGATSIASVGFTPPQTDVFFPRVLNTMVAFWVESRINVNYRATGLEEGQVFYPKLKDLALDASVPNGTDWMRSWLPRFHCRINRASKFLIALRAFIRFFIFFYGLAYILGEAVGIEGNWLDIIFLVIRVALLTALWYLAFFEVFTVPNLNKLLQLDECLDDRQGAMDYEPIRGWEDQYVDYNFDYSLSNRYNFVIGVPDPYNVCDCDDCYDDPTTHEIFVSDPQVVGSPIDSYRNFRANSYLTFPLDSGKIIKMFNFQNRLLAHTTDSIKILSYKNSDIKLSDNDASIGGVSTGRSGIQVESRNLFIGAGYLERADTLGGDLPEGSFGIQHPSHSMLFAGGYVFVDQKSNKIWLMQSLENIQDITLKGNKAFFREHLPLCTESSCIGEGQKNEIGYVFGFDPYEDLLYLTKKDGNNSAGCEKSWTMSFDMETGTWFSFHSFIPQRYIQTRKDMFSIYDNKFWIHNKDKKNFQTYYNQFHPHILEFVSKENVLNLSELDYFTFYTQANKIIGPGKVNLHNLKDTFGRGIFYNTNQCSGELIFDLKAVSLNNRNNLLDSVTDKGPVVPVTWQGEEWRVNRIRDYLDNHAQPIWLYGCDCSVGKVLNTSNINFGKDYQESDMIYDRFIKARLIYDNSNDTQLITHLTKAHVKNELA